MPLKVPPGAALREAQRVLRELRADGFTVTLTGDGLIHCRTENDADRDRVKKLIAPFREQVVAVLRYEKRPLTRGSCFYDEHGVAGAWGPNEYTDRPICLICHPTVSDGAGGFVQHPFSAASTVDYGFRNAARRNPAPARKGALVYGDGVGKS